MLKKFLATLLALFAAAAFAAVDINKASQAELEVGQGHRPRGSRQDPGRAPEGAFKDWSDLMQRVGGIKESKAAKLSEAGLTVNGESCPRGQDGRSGEGAKQEGRMQSGTPGRTRATRSLPSRRGSRAGSGAAPDAALRLPAEERHHLVAPRAACRRAPSAISSRVYGDFEQQVARQRRAARVVAAARHAHAAQQRADRHRQAAQVLGGDVVEPLARRDHQHVDRPQAGRARAPRAAAAPACC